MGGVHKEWDSVKEGRLWAKGLQCQPEEFGEGSRWEAGQWHFPGHGPLGYPRDGAAFFLGFPTGGTGAESGSVITHTTGRALVW